MEFLIVSDGALVDRILDAVQRAGVSASTVDDPTAALAQLRMRAVPVAVDLHTPGAEAFLSHLRAEGDLAGIPVTALVGDVTDAAFAEAFAWGVDEVVPLDGLDHLGAIARSLHSLDLGSRPPATRGTILVAFPDAADRRMRARPLRNVGYEVLFAADADELTGGLDRADLTFVLADAGLFGAEPARDVKALCAADPRKRPWVLVAGGSEVVGLIKALSRQPVALIARNAPPEDALFVGNDLLQARPTDGRASRRLLHATVVQYRPAGSRERIYGVSYNVSREGLYVRSVTPPPPGTPLWLELRSLQGEDLVQIEGAVAWTRPFGATDGATAPPGFGVRILDGSTRNLARWREGYAHLLSGLASAYPAQMP